MTIDLKTTRFSQVAYSCVLANIRFRIKDEKLKNEAFFFLKTEEICIYFYRSTEKDMTEKKF